MLNIIDIPLGIAALLFIVAIFMFKKAQRAALRMMKGKKGTLEVFESENDGMKIRFSTIPDQTPVVIFKFIKTFQFLAASYIFLCLWIIFKAMAP